MKNLIELSEYDDEGFFRPEKLALVHVTNYMPQKKDGHYEIESTAEATDYLFPRNTIHFTIGHHVDSHANGNWDDKAIMIVTSLKDTIDANGIPLGMSSFDTFFETTPGHNLQLPAGTHFFIPTTDPKKLEGRLSKTQGNITYYKSSGYTDEEKNKIIPDDYSSFGTDSPKKPSDTEVVLELKRNLLDDYLEKTGYVTNSKSSLWDIQSNYSFNSEGSTYAQDVAALGEKLGCRFYSSGNKLHYNHSFEHNYTIRTLCNFMSDADFILHPDEYEIVSSKTREDITLYQFQKKDGKGPIFKLFSYETDWDKRTIEMFQHPDDYTSEMQHAEDSYYDTFKQKWSPAFRKTYDVWMKKTQQRLEHIYAQAQDYPFDKAWEKVQKKIKEYEAAKKQTLQKRLTKATSTGISKRKDCSPEKD